MKMTQYVAPVMEIIAQIIKDVKVQEAHMFFTCKLIVLTRNFYTHTTINRMDKKESLEDEDEDSSIPRS